MGQQELEAALRREGEEKAREIWRLAEQAAQQLRDETGDKIRLITEQSRSRQGSDTLRLLEEARASAQYRSRMNYLAAEHRLVERLSHLAGTILQQLGESGGEPLFAALAAEIPEFAWQRITVNRRDQPLAREQFQKAEILVGEGISGGLEAQDEEGRLVIVNTLETRLQNLWAELLPEVMKELRQRIGDDEAVAINKSG